jgi:hypothetical protein
VSHAALLRQALAVVLAGAVVAAQPAQRRATNISELTNYPGFFHGRSVVIVATVATNERGEVKTEDQGVSIRVIPRNISPAEGLGEIRGEFWDIGRMRPDDPRLAALDSRGFHIDPDGPWPRPGEMLVIVATAITPASSAVAPSVRAITLSPSRYIGESVSVIGQFQGRNLGGDLPEAPGRSRYDFVLRSADAAIWVCNARPKGNGFALALDARSDTGRWLQVTGKVQESRGLLWIDAEAGTLELAKAPQQEPAPEESPTPAAGPVPEVVFSVPTEEETEVSATTNVRVQFSRDIDPSTLKNAVHVWYVGRAGAQDVELPASEFSTRYAGGNRELVITFKQGLERFRTIRVELTDAMLGTDKQPLKPWKLTFSVGG